MKNVKILPGKCVCGYGQLRLRDQPHWDAHDDGVGFIYPREITIVIAMVDKSINGEDEKWALVLTSRGTLGWTMTSWLDLVTLK